MITRKTTEQEKEAFEYLNDLRETGITNMFGAAPYLKEYLGLDILTARSLLSLWMKVFNKEGNYDQIED
ncbi:MAG TPA: hypothetical protein VIJ57_08285 [Hanamia sp.]